MSQSDNTLKMTYSHKKIEAMTTKLHYLLNLLYIGGILISMTSCDPLGTRGSGDLKTEDRNVSDFHALEVNVCGNVEVNVDSVYKVTVTCEDNIIDYLETIEDNGVLKIRFDRNVYDVDKLKITVSAPSWDAFEVNGSANVKVQDPISGSKLNLDISGSGDIDIFKAFFDDFKVRVSGSGDIEMNGSGDHLDCSVSGSGEVDMLDCPVKSAEVSISGSGDVLLDVSESLDVSISGSGKVEYKGDPQVTKNISGSGSVRKI